MLGSSVKEESLLGSCVGDSTGAIVIDAGTGAGVSVASSSLGGMGMSGLGAETTTGMVVGSTAEATGDCDGDFVTVAFMGADVSAAGAIVGIVSGRKVS